MDIWNGKRTTIILTIIAAVTAVLMLVLVLLCVPYLPHFSGDDPEIIAERRDPVETEEPTDPEPTLPPPEPNLYDSLDFQYDGRYLKLIEGESLTGIDVSSYQYDIDWQAVKDSGVDFAIIRLGYRGYESGKIVADKYAQTNLKGAAEAGLQLGVYFFSQAVTPEEAEEEAYYVLGIIKDHNITMPVVYDWESVHDEDARTNGMDKETLTRCARAFLETIDTAGYQATLYFNKTQARKLLDLAQLKDYDFWLASYTDRLNFPYNIKMWQYTNTGKVPGIEVECDINVYFPEA